MTNETKPNGGPAFPIERIFLDSRVQSFPGMTMREYAAIQLKVPDSGTDWLDEMITKSLKNDFAAKALQGICTSGRSLYRTDVELTLAAYDLADRMHEASES